VLFSSVTTQGFTGHEDDEDLGLVNMKGRLYDPKVGRFLTPDPIVSRPRFGQSWNPYSYVLNNPLSYVDPSGFEPDLLTSELPQPCSGCKGGVTTDGVSTSAWSQVQRLYASTTPKTPPPAVDAAKAGLTAAPTDVKPTGGTTSPPPEATADGAGGGSPDPRLSTGGGGADSGQIVQSQLTPDDHAGFRRNVTEESHAWGMTAALAPLRYPVVVGVIAFGLFNPDPAYAPNFDTQTEDRPSALEAVGDTTFAVAVGALGIKLGQLASAPRSEPRAYSVAFEAKLTPAQYGLPRDQHFEIARQALKAAIVEIPELGALVGDAGQWGRPTAGWTWHHGMEKGAMQLVPRVQHTPGSPFWGILHPGGVGGYRIWAIPAGAPGN
jgi:RHS repeat-associated protein